LSSTDSGPKPPNEEQLAIIKHPGQRIRVSAAAGAGKTSTLVQRYLEHVLVHGLSPESILTITFTRKAAAEMKGRIVRRLRHEGMEGHAREAESGPIQTIHSFCESLLRENAIQAGLDPEFEILAEAEVSRWLDEAILSVFTDWDDEDHDTEAFLREVSGRRSYGSGALAYESLKSPIREVLRKFRSSSVDRALLRDQYGNAETVVQHWREAFLGTLPDELARRLDFSDWKPDYVKAAFKEFGRKPPRPFLGGRNEEHELESAVLSAGLVKLSLRTWSLLEDRMLREQKLDFAALEVRAVNCVEKSPEVRERLQRKFRVALVDEAQDVNPLQDRLIQATDLEHELTVGDGQQSIYGFRQADVDHFNQRLEMGDHLKLSMNYRSHESILLFVDQVFGGLWGEDYRPMKAAKQFDLDEVDRPEFYGVELWEQKLKDVDLTANYIAEMVQEGEKPGDIVVLVRTSAFGAEVQTALERCGQRAAIVGESDRYYSRMEIRDLSNCLTALSNPCDDLALLCVLHSPLAGLGFDSVAQIAKVKPVSAQLGSTNRENPVDQMLLAEFNRWFLPLAECADKLPAWEVLSTILAKSPYLHNLAERPRGRQEVANVRKLLTIAIDAPHMGPRDFAEYIREIRELRHRESEGSIDREHESKIRIMNIHKAKGLEFPVVVVPQTFDPLFKQRQEVEIDSRLGMVSAVYRRSAKVPYHEWLAERRQQREAEEELRVLYVAMTRAQRRLCVVAGPSITKDCLAKRIAGTLGWKATKMPEGLKVRTMRAAEDL